MINNFFDKISEKKKIVIKERPLTDAPFVNEPIIPASEPKVVVPQKINVENINNFVSAYSKNSNIAQDKPRKANYQIGGANVNGRHLNPNDILDQTRTNNTQLEGWSAREIAEHRTELVASMTPQMLEAFKKFSEFRKKEKKPEAKLKEDREAELLANIERTCKETDKDDTDKMEVDEPANNQDSNDDLSFLPIQPNNNFVNMDKVEMDKLQWMRFIETTSAKNRYRSIRFHIDGYAMCPDLPDEDERQRGDSHDDFRDSLNHHGLEPDLNGYTISELYWLARCKFASQRSIAVRTIINMVRRSAELAHVHRFNRPVVTESLVDCGLLFLARWLIDAAGETYQYLDESLALLHSVIVPTDTHLSSLHIHPLIATKVRKAHKSRIEIPMSERRPIEDDILMQEDIVTCLVSNTNFLDRMSFLLIEREVSLPTTAMTNLLEILQRIALHSIEMANTIVHNHENLLRMIVTKHVKSLSQSTPSAIKLLRHICQSSQSLAHKLTRDQTIINSLYPLVMDLNISSSIIMESVCLLTTFINLGIHSGPISTIIPSIIDHIHQLVLLNDLYCPLWQPFMDLLTAYISSPSITCSPDTFLLIAQCVQQIQASLLSFLNVSVDHHPVLASMLHLATAFHSLLYTRPGQSSFDVATRFSIELLEPLLVGLGNNFIRPLADASVLAFEHRNSNLELFAHVDLSNMLHNTCRLAAKTRNPRFIDIEPFFVNLHPSWSLVSALCTAIKFQASTKLISPTIKACLNNVINEGKFIRNLADSTMELVAPVSAHSYIVQSELEAVSNMLLAAAECDMLSNGDAWDTALLVYRAAFKLLPSLGPGLHNNGRQLMDKIIFHPEFVSIVANHTSIPPIVREHLAQSLHEICHAYQACNKHLSPSENYDLLSIDNMFLPAHWIDGPSYRFLKQRMRPNPENKTLLSSSAVTSCLSFIWMLDCAGIINDTPIKGIRRMAYTLMSDNWIDDFLHPSNRLVLLSMITKYLSDPHRIDLVSHSSNSKDFYNVYMALCLQYFSESQCDSMLANVILFPSAMRFPQKYRKTFWKTFSDEIRFITTSLEESIFPIAEYLNPEETDVEMMTTFWDLLRKTEISEEDNQLIYWICIHHLNRFIFNRSILCEKQSYVQRGFAHALSNDAWQGKPWIQHIRMYKHFVGLNPTFFGELPISRAQYLFSLQQVADLTLRNV